MLYAIIGWTVLVSLSEVIIWRIFYKKTIRFITEPDLPFSRFFTIHLIGVLAFIHALFIISTIMVAHISLW